MTRQWIEEVAGACRTAGTDYLDVIIDQAGLDRSVIPALTVLALEWQSLYQGLPEEFIVDAAPLITRVNLDDAHQMQWLQELSQQVPLLGICSSWRFSALSAWLAQCTDILQEGRGGIFRFYDTRIFPLLFTHVLSEEQQQCLLRPALFWAWQDKDGLPRGMEGAGTPALRGERSHKIELSDRQLEYLCCISDVIVMLGHRAPPVESYTSRQALFYSCYQGMVDATKHGIILDEAREEWVINQWLGAARPS